MLKTFKNPQYPQSPQNPTEIGGHRPRERHCWWRPSEDHGWQETNIGVWEDSAKRKEFQLSPASSIRESFSRESLKSRQHSYVKYKWEWGGKLSMLGNRREKAKGHTFKNLTEIWNKLIRLFLLCIRGNKIKIFILVRISCKRIHMKQWCCLSFLIRPPGAAKVRNKKQSQSLHSF